MKMEDSLKSQLEDVETKLICIQHELDQLLETQQELQERKQLLEVQIDSIQNAQLQHENDVINSIDWEGGEFPWSEKLKTTLKTFFKLDTFRPLQLSCINATLSNKDAILIMPTGGGKSLCYQLPAVLSSGVTLVISPLVSLMEDQLIAVKSVGIDASMLNASCSREEVNRIHASMTDRTSTLKLLYVTPEKIAKSKRFMSKLEKMYEMDRLSRVVIDEVHCTSQWGHDFRPDYKILGILKRQFPNAPILGLTATATSKVLADVRDMLSLKHSLVFRASYNRQNLFYEVRAKPATHKTQVEEMARLIKGDFRNKSGIVYCFSRNDTEQLCMELCQRGINAGCYHADIPLPERSRVHRNWLSNNIQVIVATIAFGMGIDKPDVHFVLHHTISKSMENYYQESGRAGRDGNPAHCIVFFRAADIFRQSTMVFTEHTGLQNLYTMLKYCVNETQCRRSVIAKSFGEKWEESHCQSACDVCQLLNSKKSSDAKRKQFKRGGEIDISTSRPTTTTTSTFDSDKDLGTSSAKRDDVSSSVCKVEDISKSCTAIIDVIEKAQKKEQRLTALKVFDQWKEGKSEALKLQPFVIPRRERVLIHALLQGVLKEDFHFTPYSTISYITLGAKANAVKKGVLKIEMKSADITTRSGEISKPDRKVSHTKPSDDVRKLPRTVSQRGCHADDLNQPPAKKAKLAARRSRLKKDESLQATSSQAKKDMSCLAVANSDVIQIDDSD